MRTAWQIFTHPTSEPIDTTTAKNHLKVSDAVDDTLVDNLVKAARQHIEEMTGRSIRQQTWEYEQDEWSDEIWLPRAAPLQSVTHVKYYDTAGTQQTVATSVYLVDSKSEPARLTLKPDQSWPALQSRDLAVSVRYVTGYGSTDVPQTLLQAILLLVGHWYANREGVVTGTIATALPHAINALVGPYLVSWREPRAA